MTLTPDEQQALIEVGRHVYKAKELLEARAYGMARGQQFPILKQLNNTKAHLDAWLTEEGASTQVLMQMEAR